MNTLRHNTPVSAAMRQLVWTAAVLLALTGRTAADGTTTAPSPADSSPAVQSEVWLCAGDRILELLQPGAEWPFVKQHLTGIKLYVGQLSGNRRQSGEEAVERLRPLVRLVRAHNLRVAVELGGCLDFSPMDDTAGEWSAQHELAALANFYAAGGRVDYLDLDGPIRRLLHPENRRDGRRFDSIGKAADELVDTLKLHRAAHPETKYWLLTNFPNWGWRGDVSYHARGPQRQDYGDYDQVVRIVLEKLRAANISLDGVTVDNPYEYLVGEHFSVKLADPKSVDWLARVRSYEDFAREQGLTFNLIVNSQRGGKESDERFFRETLQMVDTYQRAGGRPTRWFVQSWYPHPKEMLPETAPDSMTALVKAVIERVRGETSAGETPERAGGRGGELPLPPASKTDRTDDAARQAELAKWDAANSYRSQTGPGGTPWDGQYRSFIQTAENAAAKGFPTHAAAARQIKENAAKSPAALAKHLGWVLFIKHFSQAYRPEAATADLKRLYEDLVAMQMGGGSRPEALPFDGDPRLIIHRDVVYGRTHADFQKLDAYLVKLPQPTPVAIAVHGGGWRRGSKSQCVYQGDLVGALLDAGISVVSIDYRLTPQHTMPAQMEDVVRAVQFVRSKAWEWNLDPERIAAFGGSAGAHLAAWVALHDDLAKPDSADPVERFSSRLTCFAALSGPMDLTRVRPTELASQPLRGQDFANAFTAAFGCTAEQYEQDPAVRQRIHDASPLFLVTPDDPPAIVMGAWREDMAVLRDPPVPAVINDPHSIWHGVLLAEAMSRAGVQVEVRIGPNVGQDREADAAVVMTFLRQCLLPPATSAADDTSDEGGSAEPNGAVRPVRVIENVPYGHEAPEAQVLTGFLVRSPRPAPVLVQIISGGWNSAPPRGSDPQAVRSYLDAGLSVVMVAHRPVNDSVHWPAPAEDVARAIQYVRSQADAWHIDPTRIAVKGRSSGGHVALMVGFGPDRAQPDSDDPVLRQSSRPTCIVAGSAPTDFPRQMRELLQGDDRQEYLRGRLRALLGLGDEELTLDQLVDRLEPLSPFHVVTRDAPPVLLLHPGPADAFWPGDARLKWDVHTPITGFILAERLKELGVPHQLVMLPEDSSGRGGGQVPAEELAFLKRYLELPKDTPWPTAREAIDARTSGPRPTLPRLELEGLPPPEPGRPGVLGFRVRAPWMRGWIEQRFPETIHSSLGLHFIDHRRPDMPPLSMLEPFPAWDRDEDTGEISYSHKDRTGLVFSGLARPYEDQVVLEYRIRNETSGKLHNISAQMCTNLGPSPNFDPKEDVTRTFTWVDGQWTSLADTTPNLARTGRHPWILMQVRGTDYRGPRENPDGWWVADQIADHGIVVRVTRDGEHLAAVHWDSAPMLMSNSRIPCLHAGPAGGVSLDPGQEVVWRGTIYLMKNDPDQLLRRYLAARENSDESDRQPPTASSGWKESASSPILKGFTRSAGYLTPRISPRANSDIDASLLKTTSSRGQPFTTNRPLPHHS